MKYVLICLFTSAMLIFSYTENDTVPDVARIHVIANSDSKHDVEVKMEVAEEISRLIGGERFDSTEKIGESLEKRIPEIENAARKILGKRGVSYGVKAEVGVKYFDKKTLGNGAFPEGKYMALVITLGEGQGHNWWSVIFPELSLRASLASGEEGGQGKAVVIGGGTVVKLRCLIRELFIDKR